MPSRIRVDFAESAFEDLQGIIDWYASQQARTTGERLVAVIFGRIEQLSDFPESGQVVPEFGSPSLRELVEPPFRIVYRLHDDRVTVVRVWRSERLMDTELDGNA